MAEEPKFKRLTFKMNDVIVKEETVSDAAYLVLKGRVAGQVGFHSENPRTVATLDKGNIFGEMALFDGHAHVATVIALEDTEVFAMSREHFKRLVASMDPVMKGIVRVLVSRLRQTVDELVPKASDVNWADWEK
ncbi:MAG TPA: cyclic nucleotide-binding domain-containing protein [Rhodospirillales bacterium]|nr:cyclic nucleotide-binding domain-containing protein [Rhodospirillales bacterium]